MNYEQQLTEALLVQESRHENNKLNYYEPYKFQKRFHADGASANQ